jgi:hypothetical protein
MRRILYSGVAAALCVAFAAAAPAHAAGLSGAVGGWSNPINGQRTLDVHAKDQTGKLVAATLYVDDQQVGSPASLCPADTRTGCQVESAELPFDTTAFPDGIHHVVVTVSDDQGAIAALLDQDTEFHNAPPANNPTATLTISSGGTASAEPSPGGGSSGSGGSGGVQGTSKSSCTSPSLSMSLAQKPLRVSHGVPVLLKSKKYRFTGRLTCVIGGRRQSAPKGAKVELLNVVKGKTVGKPKLTVAAGGKLTVVVKYASSRTLEFRYRAVDGKTSTVKIKIRIGTKKG